MQSRLLRSLALLVALLVLPLRLSGQGGVTTRISVDAAGNEGNASASLRLPAISAGNRYVAFISPASNLVPGDTNGVDDVFVYDRRTRAPVRVSVASDGTQANGRSSAPAISGDGRFVAFSARASNLVAGDTNGASDIFLHDRDTDRDAVFDEPGAIATTRVSLTAAGTQANNSSFGPAISADARYVAFQSFASNLVPGDGNGTSDIYLRDRRAGTTTWISSGGDGFSCCPVITPDGRSIAFASAASNLVAGDSNGTFDVFVHDTVTATKERASVASSGVEGNGSSCCAPSITPDGRFVCFSSDATNLVAGDTNASTDVFVHDRLLAATERASVASNSSQGDAGSFNPVPSDDGRFVVFGSDATNLVAGDTNAATDFFVRDRRTGRTIRASVASDGAEGDAASRFAAAISGDGHLIVFPSEASNLVGGDTNGARDVFVHDRSPQALLEQLCDEVTGLEIDEPIQSSLLSKLDNAKQSLAAGQNQVVISMLDAFSAQVAALRGKKIPAATADRLTAAARAIADLLR